MIYYEPMYYTIQFYSRALVRNLFMEKRKNPDKERDAYFYWPLQTSKEAYAIEDKQHQRKKKV